MATAEATDSSRWPRSRASTRLRSSPPTSTAGSRRSRPSPRRANRSSAPPEPTCSSAWAGTTSSCCNRAAPTRPGAALGNDVFYFGAALTGDDVADGGAGSDAIVLQGNYSYTFSATNLANLESISVQSRRAGQLGRHGEQSLRLRPATVDENVAAGCKSSSTASRCSPARTWPSTARPRPTEGSLIYGGQGADTLIGGHGNDTITGGTGATRWRVAKGDDLTRVDAAEYASARRPARAPIACWPA